MDTGEPDLFDYLPRDWGRWRSPKGCRNLLLVVAGGEDRMQSGRLTMDPVFFLAPVWICRENADLNMQMDRNRRR